MIIDAHLDLAYNALHGRDLTRPAADDPASVDGGVPSVSFPDLRAGNVDLCCATIFCAPASPTSPGYTTPAEAREQARAQLAWYDQQFAAGTLERVTTRAQVTARSPGKIGAIVLMEGADPIDADTAPEWVAAGVRIVGLAWRRTRHAGGTGEPGGLTESGRALVDALDRLRVIHDASHLAEQAFWELLDRSQGPIIASHSNCRAIVPTDRQLSDDMIREIARRGGVIGINLYDKFLLPPLADAPATPRRASLADVIAHLRHMCDVIGDTSHVGLGTDMDGGFGAERIPVELRTSADLPKLGPAMTGAGFTQDDVAGILGDNWRRFFAANLPTP